MNWKYKLIPKYSADREELLPGHWLATAPELPKVLKSLGWTIRKDFLPPDRLSQADPAKRQIIIARDLRHRLECPQSTRSVAWSLLAHELGHVRLHAHLNAKQIPKRWEQEAALYAQVFLVPWELIQGHDAWRYFKGNQLSRRNRWSPIYHLAKEFQVTPSFMAAALESYGQLAWDLQGFPYCPQALTRRYFRLKAA